MSHIAKHTQPWLHNPTFDGIYILLPGFLALFITILLPNEYKATDAMPLISWIVLILLIDVAHVYSTIFRTYWNKHNFSRHKTLYIAIPILCYIVGVLLYTFGAMIFWRVLAYLAVFHFIRQQYGIMRLYSRAEPKGTWSSKLDVVIIYMATLYPIIYWHCTPGRNFSWFVEGDFIITDAHIIKQTAAYAYLLLLLLYIIKELSAFLSQRRFNLPKNILIAGTALSWYFGIVYFNGDMAFTLLNVVSHGIPYMALIWIFDRKEKSKIPFGQQTRNLTILFFLLTIFAFAYIEEGLWDGLIWRERSQVFGVFSFLPSVSNKELLSFVIPLLSLPQATHYVLDGFIWKKQKDENLTH